MIIFRITEIMARYKVTASALAEEMGIGTNAISKWRHGKATPSFSRLDELMNALKKIGDNDQLELYPLQLSELLEWRDEKKEEKV